MDAERQVRNFWFNHRGFPSLIFFNIFVLLQQQQLVSRRSSKKEELTTAEQHLKAVKDRVGRENPLRVGSRE
jgi:hypothetical protein